MANIINMSIYTNEDLARDFALKADNETTPYDLTGAVLRMKIVDERNKPVADLRIGVSGRAYLYVPDPTSGLVGIRIDREVYGRRADQILLYDIILVKNGIERRLWGGEISVKGGITD